MLLKLKVKCPLIDHQTDHLSIKHLHLYCSDGAQSIHKTKTANFKIGKLLDLIDRLQPTKNLYLFKDLSIHINKVLFQVSTTNYQSKWDHMTSSYNFPHY